MGKSLQLNINVGGKQSSKGLLVNFIRQKANNYEEPVRKGTPKGEPIGFPTRKYAASLLSLTSTKPKEISKTVNVSYGVLRNWISEKAFKKQVEKHVQEFKSVFIGFVLRTWDGNRSEFEGLLKRDLEHLHEFPELPAEIKQDCLYNPIVMNAILEEAGLTIITKRPETVMIFSAINDFWLVCASKNKRDLGQAVTQIIHKHIGIFGLASNALLDEIADILDKETISKNDREKCLLDLVQLRAFLSDINKFMERW